MNNEEIYDNEIAPELKKLGDRCKELGISFLAQVEYSDDGIGRTEFLSENSSFAQKMTHWAAKAKGNFDALTMAVSRYAKRRRETHNSMTLTILDGDKMRRGNE